MRLADAIAMSQQGSMGGEPESLLTRALAMEPQNPQGLWLLGMAQSERGDHAAAISTWETLLPLLAGDARSSEEVRQLIARAQQQSGNVASSASAAVDATVDATVNAADNEETGNAGDTESAMPAPAADVVQSQGTEQLTVNVQLGDAIAQGLPASTPVFVYAKASNGPPMPLAVTRRTLGDIPFTVTLSDDDAMIPAMRLSQFAQIDVGARISRSGDAIARSGDFFGELSIQADTGEDVTIEITNEVQ